MQNSPPVIRIVTSTATTSGSSKSPGLINVADRVNVARDPRSSYGLGAYGFDDKVYNAFTYLLVNE